MRWTFVLIGWLLCPLVASAQNWGSVAGRVTETPSGQPIPGATVLVNGTNFGTATREDGTYTLRVPAGRYALRFSAVGFEPVIDSVVVARDRTATLDAMLKAGVVEMGEVTVEGDVPAAVGVYELTPEDVQNIPAPFHDGFRALKVVPGVATNNELSNQYSVRGGGFNENLIFINGFEVYLPFRPRQGEQEGLGLLNPELADRITFYTGGFPARYGGKLASALDVRYRRPEGEALTGAAYASLLDAGATASASALEGRLGWALGVRKARARRFFSTQELKGDYQPDFTDVQLALGYRIAPGHELEGLGIVADHAFDLDPSGRKTYFGIVSTDPSRPSNLQGQWNTYTGDSFQRDGYQTRFGGVRLSNRLSNRFRIEHDAAYFETVESEAFRLQSSYELFVFNPQGNPDNPGDRVGRGSGNQLDTADNEVRVRTWTGQGRYRLLAGRHAAEAGWMARQLHFDDRLSEKSVTEGAVVRSDTGESETIRTVIDSLSGAASFGATQIGAYVQDALDVLPGQPDRFVVTAGLRADYFSFNDEWTLSPRLFARYLLSERTTLTGSFGVYHQAPTYRELRGQPVEDETLLDALNRDLASQQSVQAVAGVEQFFPNKRMYLRAEAYYKHLSNLISYDIENVRVQYSGENDAKGFVYGLDLQLRGEFVPGQESWVNYSFMVARERFLDAFVDEYNDGLVPRPTDQRHTFSAYIQDYVPGDRTWKLHLRALFGSGLPYTSPVPGDQIGNTIQQVPGDRLSERFTEYRRVDAGATKTLDVMTGLRVQLTAELLNVFDMTNTVAYAWTPGRDGIWRRIPTHLTPRTLNVRVRVEF